ncbi:helix-turn-helix domain-containing protein [Streptococcus salivarius]|uniref:helix-turn-helix domain-containing protein n=1 Tax=Streptococcus salivarius TaxID=1304 RepID=UPI002027E7FD|nr:helix-turn-helix transcriptional regulator [Streptococcus salivarius]
MNFEKMNDLIISERIINARKSLNLTQEAFCDKFSDKVSLDKFRLSSLENGKRNKKKNPHFLTEAYIEFYSELLDISEEEFLFGNLKEKKNFIKLILLNVFMNADSQAYRSDIPQVEQTPIFDLAMASDEEFFRLAFMNLPKEKYGDYHNQSQHYFIDLSSGTNTNLSDMKIHREKVADLLKEIEPFFYSERFALFYTSLMDGRSIFSEQSSILLRILLGNFDFACDFLKRKSNSETIRSNGVDLRQPDVEYFYIDNYLNSVGNFSASATDWKEVSFSLFTDAFNEFLDSHIESFMEFFSKNIFNKSLKKLSNDYVNDLFSGEEFTKLLNDIYLKDQFLMKRMIGHNFSRAMIQKFSLVKENSIKLKKAGRTYPEIVRSLEDFYELDLAESQHRVYDLDKYLYDFENMTVLFANNGQKYDSGGLFLPSYFDITLLK